MRAPFSLLRTLAKDNIANALLGVGLTRPEDIHREHLTIVTFHRVLSEDQRASYPFPGLAVTPGELSWFAQFFTSHFTCLPLTEAVQRFAKYERPEKPFLAVTFDDGQLDNYENALPVLHNHELPATFFLPVDAIESQQPLWHDRLGFSVTQSVEQVGAQQVTQELLAQGIRVDAESPELAKDVAEALKRRAPFTRTAVVERLETLAGAEVPDWASMMSWEQARELRDAGHEIGSHSMSHALLPQCSAAQIQTELEESKRILEERLGSPIKSICYPNGDCDIRCEVSAEVAGYVCGVTTRWGQNTVNMAPFALDRCDMDPHYMRDGNGELSEALLCWKLSPYNPAASRS